MTSFPCDECPVERKARCSECVELTKRIFPKVPDMIRNHPSRIPPGECPAVHSLWMRANEGDMLEADWSMMKEDLKGLWAEIFSSWLFSDFDARMYSCDAIEDVESLMRSASEESKKIRRLFGFCAEIAKLSRIRIRAGQQKNIDLKDLVERMSSLDVESRFHNMIVDGDLPIIKTDENRLIMMLIEMLRGCFEEGVEIRVSFEDEYLSFSSGIDGHLTGSITTSSPRNINLYRANRMLSWDGCEMSILDDEEGVLVRISLSDKMLNVDPIPPQIPKRCIGCVNRMGTLYDFYSSMMNDERSFDLPEDCLVRPILMSSSRMKKLLFMEWDTISKNIERSSRDSCDPINSIIRMTSSGPYYYESGHSVLMDISVKIKEASMFMSSLMEINEISLTDGDLFSEGALFETTPIRRIVDDVVSGMNDLINQSGAEIIISTDLPSPIIRKKRWARALSEIMENSIVYSGVERPRITIWSDGNRVFINDNGIGIPREKWGVIFDIFTSLNMGRYETIRKRGSSHGVGLFLAKRYIQWDGGDVRVTSSNEKGTTIDIALPSYTDRI